MLGLHCTAQASSGCSEAGGLSLAVGAGFSLTVASVGAQALAERAARSCGSRALEQGSVVEARGFPGGSVSKESVPMQESQGSLQVHPELRRSLEKAVATPVFLPGKFPRRQRA